MSHCNTQTYKLVGGIILQDNITALANLHDVRTDFSDDLEVSDQLMII